MSAEVRVTSLPTPSLRLLGLRLGGALVVGALISRLAFDGVAGAAVFGAWAGAGSGAVVLAALSTGLLAALHRATGGAARRPLRWGAGVTAGGVVLAVLCSVAWQQSGGTFGRTPPLWWLAGGSAFLLCAAVGTRATRVPASVVLVPLVALAALSLVPEAPGDGREGSRGCIAASQEEAERTCR